MLSCTLICILLFSGCSSNKPATNTSIQEILAKASSITSIKYDMVTTFLLNGTEKQNRNQTVWEKAPFMKINASTGSQYQVFIQQPSGNYTNINGTHKFTKINGPFPGISVIKQATALRSNITFRIVGNETFDGVATTLLQYSTTQSGGSTTTKLWIWDDKGIPIKTQVTVLMGSINFVTTTVIKNIDFSDIPDSEFSIVSV